MPGPAPDSGDFGGGGARGKQRRQHGQTENALHGPEKQSPRGVSARYAASPGRIRKSAPRTGCRSRRRNDRCRASCPPGWAAGSRWCIRRSRRAPAGLLPDHAQPAHFLHALVAVGDDPVAADHLGRVFAGVGDANGIGEHELVLARIGLFGNEARRDRDAEVVRFHSPSLCGDDAPGGSWRHARAFQDALAARLSDNRGRTPPQGLFPTSRPKLQ